MCKQLNNNTMRWLHALRTLLQFPSPFLFASVHFSHSQSEVKQSDIPVKESKKCLKNFVRNLAVISPFDEV